jgi:hypothetical protein
MTRKEIDGKSEMLLQLITLILSDLLPRIRADVFSQFITTTYLLAQLGK